MKQLIFVLIGIQFILFYSCSSDDESGLRIEISDKYILTTNDIEFYDSSTCILFLKENINLQLRDSEDYINKDFSIYIDDNLIYNGVFFPAYASMISPTPIYIATYSNDSIDSELLHFKFSGFPHNSTDNRNDSKLIDYYKNNDLLRNGINCKIENIERSLSGNSILNIDLCITNNDDCRYLIPDLSKISSDQFFNLSGQFIVRNYNSNFNIPQILDDYILDKNVMTLDNLTVLEKREEMNFTVTAKFDSDIEKGNYSCELFFGNITYIKFIDLDFDQDNARVWIGEDYTKTDFEIN